MNSISRFIQLGVVFGVCFFSACADSTSNAEDQSINTAPQEVMMYLHNGTDKTGTIVSFDGNQFGLKTKDGIEKVERALYQGMVLNTPVEKEFSEQAARDMGLYMSGSQFVYELRNRIKANLVEPKTHCEPKNFPIFHVLITRDLRIKDRSLLLSSGCKDLDAAVIKAVNGVKPPAFPVDVKVDFYPVNYFYEPPGFQQKTDKPAEPEKKS